jgi:predicted GIY-YIG superfamily endonuclease
LTERLPELLDAKPTTVYVARGKRNVVLYVGITGRTLRRMHAHARASAWWPLAKKLELRHFDTAEKARHAERELIQRWEPEFNIVHNGTQKDRERSAAGLFTAEELAVELGWPAGLARMAARHCASFRFGQKNYVRLVDVHAWFDAKAQVISPGAEA